MQRILHLLLCGFLCGLVLIGGTVTAAAKTPTASALQKMGNEILQAADVKTLLETAGNSPTDWYLIAASGMELAPEGTQSALKTALQAAYDSNALTKTTDAARVLLAYAVSGGSITDIAGDGKQNAARDRLYQEPSLLKSGINAMVYALQALDAGAVSLPADALHTRKELINAILALQLTPSGGFTLAGSNPDPDMTAMVVAALAPYYQTEPAVAKALEQALLYLSNVQLENGGFQSYGIESCESAAQVVIALTALGIDPTADSRFVKAGGDPVSAMLRFAVGTGMFSHTVGGKANGIASGQAFCGMAAYWRFLTDRSALYAPQSTQAPVYRPIETTKETASAVTASKTASRVNTVTSQDTVSSSKASDPQKEVDSASSVVPTAQSSDVTSAVSSLPQTPRLEQTASFGWKQIVAVVFLMLASGLCVVIAVLTKKGYRLLKQPCAALLMGAVILALVAVLLLTIRVQTVDDYYADTDPSSAQRVGTVTLTVECTRLLEAPETVPAQLRSEIPKNGYLLPETTVDLYLDDTAFSVLKRALKQYQIPLEYSESGGAYVEGIGYLYELSCGDLSGWVYAVNGEQAKVACSDYVLSNHDSMVWSYSLELGQDVF